MVALVVLFKASVPPAKTNGEAALITLLAGDPAVLKLSLSVPPVSVVAPV